MDKWLVYISNPGPARSYLASFTDHVYIYEDEHPSGHCHYYLGSIHFSTLELKDYNRAIYRAQSLIKLFNAIQRLTGTYLLYFEKNNIYINGGEAIFEKDEGIALEELSDPFSINVGLGKFDNIYDDYFDLAANDYLVRNVLYFVEEAFNYPHYFYINVYRINETIENDWPELKSRDFSYSTQTKASHSFLNAGNVRGYMNNFIVSGFYSRHGYVPVKKEDKTQTIRYVPPVEEIKKHLLFLVNGWLNYKLDSTTVKYSRVCIGWEGASNKI